MKIARLAHDPSQLLDFYEEGLGHLGALCERTWHDRLQVIAEGSPAALFGGDAHLREVELHFASADATAGRAAASEVFPGCPLTFRLAETLFRGLLNLERFVLAQPLTAAPDAAVAEKLWRAQFPEAQQWRLIGAFKPGWHFSLAAVARSEIQAIDQHWSLHRIAFSLPKGEADDDLARNLAFHEHGESAPDDIPWPVPDLPSWCAAIEGALLRDLHDDLAKVRARQGRSLQRELDRIDDYFAKYERELTERRSRGGEAAQAKKADRLAAARTEHARRRDDQVYRHEIRIVPHVDALLLVSEKAWRAEVRFEQARQAHTLSATFLPRSRRWLRESREPMLGLAMNP